MSNKMADVDWIHFMTNSDLCHQYLNMSVCALQQNKTNYMINYRAFTQRDFQAEMEIVCDCKINLAR